MSSVLDLARPDILALQPYAHAAWDPSLERLHANEMPWRAQGDNSAAGLNRYPEPQPHDLVERMASLYDVPLARVLVGRGSDEAIDLLVRAFCRAGLDGVVITPPTFGFYKVAARVQGAGVIEVPLDRETFALDLPAVLEAGRRARIVFLCSPNNPTGTVYSRETIEAIAQFAKDHDLWLVSDEVYWTHAKGTHISPLSVPGMAERTLVINSVSKSHGMTGWRVGWMRGPAWLIEKMNHFNLIATYGLPDFVSHAAAQALDNDWGVEEIAQRYAARRELFRRAFDGSNGVIIRGSKGGMYAMLDVRAVDSDGERFAFALLDAEGVAVMPGESFGHAAAGHIRISLVQDDAVLADAIARIKRFVAARALAA